MSTLVGRSGLAVLVVDAQNGVLAQAHDRSGVVRRIHGLIDRARVGGVPVVWVQHHDGELVRDGEAWRIVPELVPRDGEPVVHKSWNDAFEETDLEQVLAGLGVDRLVVVGAQTEWCIRATLHGAIARGYDALLVADAHTTNDASPDLTAESIVAMTNAYWTWHAAPGRAAGTEHAADVDFSR